MSNDAYYTPSWLAASLLRATSKRSPRMIADFAAGDGALLEAAEHRWPKASILAADYCDSTIRRLRRRRHHWLCTRVDFLDANSRRLSRVIRPHARSVDLILLNPPFSCRGGTTVEAGTPYGPIPCGRAMGFVLTALQYLSPAGEIIALLPANVLHSQKDKQALALLQTHYSIFTSYAESTTDFEGCRVNYLIARIKRSHMRESGGQATNYRQEGSRSISRVRVEILRGTSQMHDLPTHGRTLVHTTDLHNHKVELNGHCGYPSRPSIIGPAILIPRVGAPSVGKACLYLRRKRIVLSDCVVGIQCRSSDDAMRLMELIRKHESKFVEMYSGTCARYLTLERLRCFLDRVGYVAS